MKTRIHLDAYYTSSKLVEQLLLKYPISKDKVILECCNGKGHISTYLKQLGYEVITNDIDKETDSHFYFDFSKINEEFKNVLNRNCVSAANEQSEYTVITNPPFNVANKILENCLDIVDEVIMLLRLSFIEPCKERRAVLNQYKDNLVKVIPISPRPQFRSDTNGSDSVTVAWFIWNKQFSWNKLDISCPFDFITDWK